MAYRSKTGPLDAGGKLEVHMASLQSMIVRAMGGEASPADFLYGVEAPEPEQAGIDMNQAIAAFRSAGEM